MVGSSVSGSVICLGIDRHGRASLNTVRLTHAGVTNVGFVGSTNSCGAFSPSTGITLSDGSTAYVSALISEGKVGRVSFEHYLECESEMLCTKDVLEDILHCTSAYSDETKFVFRYRDQDLAVPESRLPTKAASKVQLVDGVWYSVLQWPSVISSLAKGGRSVILELGRTWLNSGEGRIEVETDAYPFVLCYLSALIGCHREYRLYYDSLQYTSIISIHENDRYGSGPVARGRCAFLLPFKAQEFVVEWDDPSWAPICSGFLLS